MDEITTDSIVLLVEDDQALRNLMQTLLHDLFDVPTLAAADGEEALRLARDRRPSLILLDVMLSGAMDGLAVARELKTRPETMDIPIVAVTASESREKALLAGCSDYVHKPFEMAYFIKRVQCHLKKEVAIVCL